MKQFRIKEINGKFYPQERYFFFFWCNIKLHDRVSRDWFIKYFTTNCYDGTVTYLVAKDAWGVTHWFQPEFKTLERAKTFIDEYKKFLKRKYENKKANYYY